MNDLAVSDMKRTPAELRKWLSSWPFTRFVTLTLNEPGMGVQHRATSTAKLMRERLYQFDARMNRKLIGRDWQKRPHNRMYHFFAPEKLDAHPHWHGVVCFYGAQGDELRRQEAIFDRHAGRIWNRLVPKGSTDVKPINDLPGGIDYVVKTLSLRLNFDHCIVPDEFWATHL